MTIFPSGLGSKNLAGVIGLYNWTEEPRYRSESIRLGLAAVVAGTIDRGDPIGNGFHFPFLF